MTDNEIVKDLECCLRDVPPCYACKYDADTITPDECMGNLMKDTLDLINRQKAEIENLNIELKIKSQKRANIFEITDAFERGRSRGIKEFADKLKKSQSVTNCESEWLYLDIDDLVKEMVGDPK